MLHGHFLKKTGFPALLGVSFRILCVVYFAGKNSFSLNAHMLGFYDSGPCGTCTVTYVICPHRGYKNFNFMFQFSTLQFHKLFVYISRDFSKV